MEINKLREILQEECCKTAARVVGHNPEEPNDLEGEDRSKVRAAWRHKLSRLGVTWQYDHCGDDLTAPEGHVAVEDFMTDKGCTTLFIPNELAENMLVLGEMPIPLKKTPVRNRDVEREPIMRAARNTTEYLVLSTVTASEDGRRIIFVFNNGTSLFYNVANTKWCHSNTELEMGDSHFKNIQWGEGLFMPPPAPAGRRWTEFKAGRDGFYEQIAQIATEGWVKTYFTLLARWVKSHSERNRRGSDGQISKRLVNASNRLDMLTGDNSMAIESLAKNQYIQQMPLNVVCDIAFSQSKVLDFKAFRERGMDSWFCKHVAERASTEYVIKDHAMGIVDESKAQLGAWLDDYHYHTRMGDGELWQYVWEKYKFAVGRSNYNWSRLKKITERGFKAKKVMDYVFHILPMQGMCNSMIYQNWDSLVTLDDYARMQQEMTGGNYERYPKGLKMSHDIAARNHRVKQSNAFAERFASVCESIKSLEFSDKEFSIVLPKSVNDIVNEGAALNHCVASYVSGVVDRQYSIVFLRKADELDKPLVTVQISADGKTVLQSRGHSNRDLTADENKFLAKYRDHLDPSRQKSLFNIAEDMALNPQLVEAA